VALVVARREQILYLVVGGWNTLFGYGVFALLYHLLHDVAGVPKIPGSMVALIVASVVGIANNYVLYRTVVFSQSRRGPTRAATLSGRLPGALAVNLVALPLACMSCRSTSNAMQAVYTVAVRSGQLPANKLLQLRADSSRRMGVRCIQLSEQARRRGR